MILTRTQLDAMLGHARSGLPNEACGLLEGAGNTVAVVHCLENAHHSPTTYELTSEGLILAGSLDDEDRLLGAFHSHPHGPAYPSMTDRRQAFWPIRYVIISLADRAQPQVRAFRIIKHNAGADDDLGQVTEEDVVITDGATNA